MFAHDKKNVHIHFMHNWDFCIVILQTLTMIYAYNCLVVLLLLLIICIIMVPLRIYGTPKGIWWWKEFRVGGKIIFQFFVFFC